MAISIAGIDASLTGTGLFVREIRARGLGDPKPFEDSAALIETTSEHSDWRRQEIIVDRLRERLEPVRRYGKLRVFIEDHALGKSMRNSGKLFVRVELVGMIKMMLREELSADVYMVTPNVLKSFATGRGNADKKLMMDEARRRYRAVFTNDNVCDGFWLMRFGFAYLVLGQRLDVAKIPSRKDMDKTR